MGSIDRTLRERLLVELRQILRTLHLTAIYVTHDQEEAFAIADRIVLMKAGQIEQVDTPQRLYRHPATVFVAHFLGMTNILSGEVHQIKGGFIATTAIGDFPIPMQKRGKVTILLRPDSAYLDGQGDYHLTGNVSEISFRGGYSRMVVKVEDTPLEFDFHPSASLPDINQTIHLSFEAREAIQVFEAEE